MISDKVVAHDLRKLLEKVPAAYISHCILQESLQEKLSQ